MRTTYANIFNDLGVELLPVKQRSKHILAGYGPNKKRVTNFLPFAEYIISGGNYALKTGTGSRYGHPGGGGLVVIDFDDPSLFTSFSGESFTVKTARGYHVYYWSDDLRSFAFDDLDVLGVGKAVIGPWCEHPSGIIYEPINDPVIRGIESVFDFPLLSDLEPVELPEPPKDVPKRLSIIGHGRGKVARIKAALPILDVVKLFDAEAAQTVSGRGRWRQYCCSFHDDRHRSGWLDTERNLYGCHACNVRTGDVISYAAKSRDITNGEAIDLLGGWL